MAFRIPKALWSAAGPLPVSIEESVDADGSLGEFDGRPRTVKIDKASGPATRAQTFWHEAVHVGLWDSGIHNMLTPDVEEAICDAIGNYLAAMQGAGCLTVRAPKE